MMLSLKEETPVTNSRADNPPTALWFYLSFEFLVGLGISGFLTVLSVLKSLLPKPPRDITGDVVLVAGASSTLGESLAEEFAKGGCSVICVDKDRATIEDLARRLRSKQPRIEEISSRHRKQDEAGGRESPTIVTYECNLMNRDEIRNVARMIKDEVGRIDVLVTCAGCPDQDIFDTASTTLMAHYWTVLAFLPSMLQRGRAHVVGVTPVASDEDHYIGSRAAIAGLMESLGRELGNGNSQLTFLSVAPIADRRFIRQSEQQIARDVVQAVRRDQRSLSVSWSSRVLYRMSCAIYGAITTITQWLRTQGCEDVNSL